MGRMLDDDVGALVLEGDTQLGQELVGRLAHHHGAEELSSEPGTTTCAPLYMSAHFDACAFVFSLPCLRRNGLVLMITYRVRRWLR